VINSAVTLHPLDIALNFITPRIFSESDFNQLNLDRLRSFNGLERLVYTQGLPATNLLTACRVTPSSFAASAWLPLQAASARRKNCLRARDR
jgi:hypothetical protein